MKKFLAQLLVLCMVLSMAACGAIAESEVVGDTYTYNYSLSTFPTTWNFAAYQTSTDAEILDYIVDGFYIFDYNDTMDGYQMVPSMATGDPVDVTADYIGQFGLEEGAVNQAWKVTLRDDLKWQNGDAITAKDFVESAKRLLDPVAQNYRADTMYSGSFVISGAESYLKQGKTVKQDNGVTKAYTMDTLVKGEDGAYTTPDGSEVYIAVDYALDWCSGNTLSKYVATYGNTYFGMDTWDQLAAMADENGLVALTDESLALLTPVTTSNAAWGETEADLPNYFIYNQTFPEVDFDTVGVIAVSDYELVYVIDKPLSGFYLKYNMPSSYLVHVPTYDALANVDAEGIYTNTYGTSPETTMSYGPYMLTEFQADKHYVLERNANFHGLTEDTYQTTHIDVVYVAETATRHQMFLQGELDSFGLDAEYMPTYQLSDNTYYYTGASTYAITFNPSYDGLLAAQKQAGEGINKTILTVKEFRMAMSFALDRLAFCLATSPTNNAAFGLFSGLIISDPEAGVAYRTTEPAKDALVNFWALDDSIGEGKLYADKDEAIASLTGYNLTQAKELFNQAYDIAIETGLMTETDVVEIKIGLPSATANFYKNGYEFLVNNYTEAVVGTKLEGKLTFSKDDTIGNGFADALNNNTIDMLFGVGWSGSALDPYGLFQVYVDPNYQYDAGIDYSSYMLTIDVNGNKTTDMVSWYQIMNGEACEVTDDKGVVSTISYGSADGDSDARLKILAAMENEILCQYNFIPIMDNSNATLKGMQIEYKTEEYIYSLGFGGIKYYTYNYSDAEWAEFVQTNGGTLDYT